MAAMYRLNYIMEALNRHLHYGKSYIDVLEWGPCLASLAILPLDFVKGSLVQWDCQAKKQGRFCVTKSLKKVLKK